MNRSSTALNWLVALLAGAGLAIAVTTIFVASGNRELQRDVARRQQEVNQALQLQPLNNQLIQALAALSVQRNDPQLAKILTDNGITVQLNAPAAPAAPGAPK
jgi:hypothetical protein